VASEELVVRGNEQLLARALGNIVDNAVQHGRGDITISAGLADDRRVAVVTIHDEGEMNPDFLAHAAERFRQDESSRTGTGAGLGLSLVDAIAIAHHGQARICSAGVHHPQPSPSTTLTRIPCAHSPAGTTISLLLAASPVGSGAVDPRA